MKISFYLAEWVSFQTGYVSTSNRQTLDKADIKGVSEVRNGLGLIYPKRWIIQTTDGQRYVSVDQSLSKQLEGK